jgi:hypothetical protein
MSRDYLRRNRLSEQFAPRAIRMLESPAYRALSIHGHRILSRIEIELAHHGGRDNGKLPVTFDQFVEYGVRRHSVGPGIRELEALGFIEITEQGRAGNAEWRRPNKFRLTHSYVERAAPTDEWARIKTDEEAAMIAKAARRKRSNSGRRRPKPDDPEENFPVTLLYGFQSRKRHHNSQFHSVESVTTSHGAESVTTSKLSGRGRGMRGLSLRQDVSPEPEAVSPQVPSPTVPALGRLRSRLMSSARLP